MEVGKLLIVLSVLVLAACPTFGAHPGLRGLDSLQPRFQEPFQDFTKKSGAELFVSDGDQVIFTHTAGSKAFSVALKSGGGAEQKTRQCSIAHGRVDAQLGGKRVRFIVASPYVIVRVDDKGNPTRAFVKDWTKDPTPPKLSAAQHYMLVGREPVDLFGGYANVALAGGVSMDFPHTKSWRVYEAAFKPCLKSHAALLKKKSSTSEGKDKEMLEAMSNAVPNTFEKMVYWHDFMEKEVIQKWNDDTGDLWTDKELDGVFANPAVLKIASTPANFKPSPSAPKLGALDKKYEKMLRDGIKSGVQPLFGMLDKALASEQERAKNESGIADNRWYNSIEEQRLMDVRKTIKNQDFPSMFSDTIYEGMMSNPWANEKLVGVNRLANRAEAEGMRLASIAEKKLKNWMKKMGKVMKSMISSRKQASKANTAVAKKGGLEIGEKEIAQNAFQAATTKVQTDMTEEVKKLESPQGGEVTLTGEPGKLGQPAKPDQPNQPTPEEKGKWKFKCNVSPQFQLGKPSEMLKKIRINPKLLFEKGNVKHELNLDVKVDDPFKTGDVTAKLAWKRSSSNGLQMGADITSVVAGTVTKSPTLKSVVINAFVTYKDKKGLSTGCLVNINSPFAKNEAGKTVAGPQVMTINPFLTKTFGNKKTTAKVSAIIKTDGFIPSKLLSAQINFSLEHNFSPNTRIGFMAMHKNDKVAGIRTTEAMVTMSHSVNNRLSLNIAAGATNNGAGGRIGLSYRF